MAYTVELTALEISELKTLRKTERDGKILRRYQCIWFAHEKFPKKEIASMLCVNIDTVTDWIKIFNKGKLLGLRELKYDGRRHSSLDAIKDALLNHIKNESVSKISQLQHFLKSKHSIVIEHSWLSRYCKKNSIALIKKRD
jgi:transposase